jgi:hypothetical protein
VTRTLIDLLNGPFGPIFRWRVRDRADESFIRQRRSLLKELPAVTKVWKSVGAVRVYNPAKAALAVAGGIIVIGAAGFGLGAAVAGGSDEDDAAAPVRPASTATPPAGEARERESEAPAPKVKAESESGARAVRKAGYKRGYAAGASKAFGGLGDPGAYVIRVKESAGGAPQIVQSVTVESGRSYYLCEGGTRLCIANGGDG